MSDNIAKVFLKAEDILKVSHAREVTFQKSLKDITKLDIKLIDDNLRKEETSQELMIFKDGENKMFKVKPEQFNTVNLNLALREKCPNMEFFLVRIFPYSDSIRRFTG